MSRDLILRQEDLFNNPTPRCPVCLVLDCSPSMSGDPRLGAAVLQTNPRPIDELNRGVKQFFHELKSDEIAASSVEVAVVAFSGVADRVLDFASMERSLAPTLEIERHHGGTSIGAAVQEALRALDARKTEYQRSGVDYYQPWLVLMSDGQPTDDTHHEAARAVADLVSKKKLTVFSIGIGAGVDMSTLAMFSPGRQPLKLKGLEFAKFFKWLSESAIRTSQSTPGEKIPLDVEGIRGWAEL